MAFNTILTIFYITSAPLLMFCEIVTMYYKADKTYANKLCSQEYLELEFFASSAISCLTTCLSSESSSASIYHRNSSTCYSIRAGYHGYCTIELAGAKMYKKDSDENTKCPIGWTFIHKSCYMIIADERSQDQISAICRTHYEYAHLADIKTNVELERIKEEFASGALGPMPTTGVWLGAMNYNTGWFWGDVSPVEDNQLDGISLSSFDELRKFEYATVYCLVAQIEFFIWTGTGCQGQHVENYAGGLCELDMA